MIPRRSGKPCSNQRCASQLAGECIVAGWLRGSRFDSRSVYFGRGDGSTVVVKVGASDGC